MAVPTLPETTSIDGSETVIVRKGTNPYRAMISRIFAVLVKPFKMERVTSVTNSNGLATFTFTSGFSDIPDVQPLVSWSGEQMISGAVTSVSKTGCTVQVMMSRGTLALSSGPFQKAGSGVSITVRAMGT